MQRVVVVGAGGGIGREVCRRIVAAGGTVVACGRRAEPLLALKAELPAAVEVRELDATNAEAVSAMLETVAGSAPITGVANLAGAFLLKPAHLTSPAELNEQIAQNLTTAFNVVRGASKAMMNTGGSIVLMSSVAAKVGLASHEAVAATKAAVEGLARSAAASYAARGIRVNVVAPGLTRTPLTERITGNEASLKVSVAMHPLGRIGEPPDIASAIMWLLSPDSGWVTGQTIGVDGGLGNVRAR
jgi:NAD(P)-dependent dehydrogenase (short-subunit alcohol dehydrogenase family)